MGRGEGGSGDMLSVGSMQRTRVALRLGIRKESDVYQGQIRTRRGIMGPVHARPDTSPCGVCVSEAAGWRRSDGSAGE
jgi:hypothetical protein